MGTVARVTQLQGGEVVGTPLNDHEAGRLAHCESIIERAAHAWAAGALALAEIREARLYRATHGTFEAYVRERWDLSRGYAHRLIEAAAMSRELTDAACKTSPLRESQVRPLKGLKSPEARVDAWMDAVDKAKRPGDPTAREVADAVGRQQGGGGAPPKSADERAREAATSSESEHWYTPERYVAPAREVMGGIDLDPASCEEANRTIKAERIYTEEGLEKPWEGRVWLNPPYRADGAAGVWVANLIAEYEAKRTTMAAALINAYVGAVWWRRVWATATAICFPDHRIRFIGPGGEVGEQPTKHNAIVFWGPDQQTELFCAAYMAIGPVVPMWAVRGPWHVNKAAG